MNNDEADLNKLVEQWRGARGKVTDLEQSIHEQTVRLGAYKSITDGLKLLVISMGGANLLKEQVREVPAPAATLTAPNGLPAPAPAPAATAQQAPISASVSSKAANYGRWKRMAEGAIREIGEGSVNTVAQHLAPQKPAGMSEKDFALKIRLALRDAARTVKPTVKEDKRDDELYYTVI